MSRAWAGGSTRAWRQIRAAVLQRDEYQCQIRGPRCTHRATTVDHRIPKSQGGTDTPANLRAACYMCNVGRGAPIADPAPLGRW